jgi:hypothetical protein
MPAESIVPAGGVYGREGHTESVRSQGQHDTGRGAIGEQAR